MPSARSMAWLGVVLVAAVTGFFLARRTDDNARPANPARVALVTGGAGPFWQYVISGARSAAVDHGAELVVMAAGDGIDGQFCES